MSQKNEARHLSNCQIAAESTIIATAVSSLNVPSRKRRKRKEDSKQILYLNRI